MVVHYGDRYILTEQQPAHETFTGRYLHKPTERPSNTFRRNARHLLGLG